MFKNQRGLSFWEGGTIRLVTAFLSVRFFPKAKKLMRKELCKGTSYTYSTTEGSLQS